MLWHPHDYQKTIHRPQSKQLKAEFIRIIHIALFFCLVLCARRDELPTCTRIFFFDLPFEWMCPGIWYRFANDFAVESFFFIRIQSALDITIWLQERKWNQQQKKIYESAKMVKIVLHSVAIMVFCPC